MARLKVEENQKIILQKKIEFLNKNTKNKFNLIIKEKEDKITLTKNSKFLTAFFNMADDNREDQAAIYAYYYLKALCENI